MAENFNVLQEEVRVAALGLSEARENMRMARNELIARHEEIVHRAHHDPLTDLPNRTALAKRLEEMFESTLASGGSFSVLTIDLDHFKEANDVFGHVVGDELLCSVSRRLKHATNGEFISRVGGDEFTLVLRDAESAPEQAERVLACISDAFEIQGQQIIVGLSIGVATYPTDAGDVETLLANADAALYRAKADGRKLARFFDHDLDTQLRERYALQHDLRLATLRDEFVLYYQPQAKIEGEVFGFEALIRWQHPKRGIVLPDGFISLAEQNGKIVDIGNWVLREACRQAVTWSLPLQISVNLSPVQFQTSDLVQVVGMTLRETGLAPERLELEITEGVLINDPARALIVLTGLKALGVKIAMDDFGKGYASLSSLQSFPFDKIKIGRAFVSGVDTNESSAAIVRAVIGLGNALRVPVIAEGVETELERVFLMLEGCREIQGYLVGKPEPIDVYADLTSGRGPEQERGIARAR
jgi:diguanylate cyclase (GGDEF)-like protein